LVFVHLKEISRVRADALKKGEEVIDICLNIDGVGWHWTTAVCDWAGLPERLPLGANRNTR